MRFLIAFFLLIALPAFGAVPSYTSFRGSGGILITSNPPTGNITIDGSAIFTSSGTNATIAVSTNGVLVMVAATNVNFVKGTNVVLTATNIGSVAHIGIHAISPIAGVAEGQSITVTTNGTVYTVAAGLKDFLMSSTNRFVWSNGTALVLSPTNDALFLFNTNNPGVIKPALIFSDGVDGAGFQSETGTIIRVVTVSSNLFPGTNRNLGKLLMRQLIMRDGSQEEGRFLRSVDTGGASTWAEVLTISNVVSLSVSNLTSKPITNSVITPGILYLYGIEGGSNVVLTMNGSNIVINSAGGGSSVAPPNASVQYNSNGVQQGSAGFIYTNGQVRVADIVVAGQGVEITTGSLVLNGGATALASWAGLGNIRWPSSGVVRFENDFSLNLNRIQLGGDTAAFPAIGRTNGDVIILGANGAFKAGDATNKLRAPAVYLANDSGMGTPLLRLENPLNAIGWDLAINSNPETFLLGLGSFNEDYAMVWELTSGNVGIGITNPTVRLDVQGRFMARSNVYFPNIASNALPVAFLATDSDGQVYETAVPTGSSSSVTNVVSLSTSNATSKPLTNSYTGGVLTVFGLEGGSGVTIAPNGSNLVISSSASAVAPPISSVQFNSNGVQQGSSGFMFTNGTVGLGGIAVPQATLDVSNAVNNVTRPIFHAGTNANNGLTVSTNGKVGIGTSAPIPQASIVGSSQVGGGILNAHFDLVTGTGAEGDNKLIFGVHDGDYSWIQASQPGISWRNLSLQPALGNVGIGTTGPVNRLDIEGALAIGAAYSGTSTAPTDGAIIVGSVGIGTNQPLVKLDVVGGIRSHTVTASRIAAFHTDKTLTNSRTSSDLFQMFFDMGISNIVAADSGLVIRTNAGVLTISNTVAATGGTTPPGNSNQIPFLNVAGTAYMYAGYSSITNPGFGFSPSGPSGLNGGYGGLMVFADKTMGLVTIGHPNPSGDFSTLNTALVISNRYNGLGDFKNDMVKIDAVLVNSSTLQADSTMTRWRVWQAPSGGGPSTSSNDVAELTIGGRLTLAGGLATNNAAFTITTNNFALDTYYTNMAQRSWVSASIGMTNVLLTEKAWVGLYLDQDGDGTWERTGINVRLQGISALAGVEQLGAFLQPSARFMFTNLGTVANSSIEPNSSQWVKQ